FDLIFMDPPYGMNMVYPTLMHLHDSAAARPAARIVIEHGIDETMPKDLRFFRMIDHRKYGKTLVSFFDYML
ncbi:MAG: RsmD family RNA methyltransferase, partial [Deltaproteobacteria bacterium]|nr:RsmD family RNA methyltransferase [Deltaproteobacteria bacterium]